MDRQIVQLADAFGIEAVDPSQWMPALMSLADATGSSRGQLIGIGGDASIPFNWVNDFSEGAHRRFIEMDGGNPRINPRVAVSVDAPLLGLQSESDYADVREKLASEIYLDFASDTDIPHGCQSKIFASDQNIVGLAVLRSEGDGKTTAAQRALFSAVAPYVRNAVRMQMALENDGARLIAGTLDAVSAAVFICARDGRVLAKTSAAEKLLASGRVSMTGDMIVAPHPGDQERLNKAIARHSGRVAVPLESLALRGRGEQELPLVIDVTTAPRSEWALGFRPHVLVIARGARSWHGSAEAVLQSAYGLSPAEADIALRLARGQARSAIAEERGARLETIRSQIKAIFAKLGINRETELTAMLSEMLQL